VTEGDDTCPACGEVFSFVCLVCDGEVSAEDEVCPHCGAEFGTQDGEDEAGEAEGRPFAVELYLPPDLAELDRCPACHAPMDFADGLCSECGQIVCPRCGGCIGDEDEVCPDCRLALVFPCPTCHLELTTGTEVCPDCNTLFVQTCPACGTRVWDGATVCPQCDQAWELPRYDPIHTT
jgi:predicted amidophosphoribosyltransferase